MRLETLSKVQLPTVSIGITTTALREAGVGGAAIFEEFRARPPEENYISAAEEIRYQRAFVELTRGDPEFWTRTGLHYGLLAFGAYGLAVSPLPPCGMPSRP